MSFTKGPQTHCNNVEKVQLTHSEQVVHFKVAFLLSFHSAGICFYYLSFSSTLTKKVFCFCFFFKSNPMSYFPPLPYPLFSPLSPASPYPTINKKKKKKEQLRLEKITTLYNFPPFLMSKQKRTGQ